MKKIILIILSIPLFLIVISVLVLGYFGFVPGLSNIMGTNKPKNLGVAYTTANFNDYQSKAKFESVKTTIIPTSGKTLDFSGKTEVKETFTPSEVSARINYSAWKYMPLTNFQIRFPAEDTVEFSGNLMLNRFPGFIETIERGKVSKEDVEKFMKFADITMTNPPIYVLAKASATENKTDIVIQKMQIGKFNLDPNKYNLNRDIEGAVEEIFSHVPEFYAKSVKFTPQGMYFEGTTPNKSVVLSTN